MSGPGAVRMNARAAAALAALLAAAVPGVAAAQRAAPRDTTVRPPSGTGVGIGGTGGDTTRAPGDTARRPAVRTPRASGDTLRTPGDSAAADTAALVTFAEDDSTLKALRARPGYDAVRYQGDTVRFDARTRLLTLRGHAGAPAAVERGSALLVGRNVRYNDSLRVVTASADSAAPGAPPGPAGTVAAALDSVVLRDPSQGADVIVRDEIRYNLDERRGLVRGFSTSVAQGETWFVRGGVGAFATDSARANDPGAGRTFYAHDGAVTSCDETTPHYHFQARDIKFVSKSLLVIRPAVLYIGNVPVMWFPFVFQDTRPGRRSGLLRPTFGVAELIRNSPNYQRSLRNLGYYTTLGDYADVRAWLDFRSGARPGNLYAFGYSKYNLQTRYKVIDRFIDGDLAVGYERQTTGARNLTLSLQHSQAFNQSRRVRADINFVQNTYAQQLNAFNLYQARGSIRSSLNFEDKFGPVSLSVGGTGEQYPGRPIRVVNFPNLNLASPTLNVAPWLDWTPTLSVSNSQSFKLDQGPQFTSLYRTNAAGGLDSTRLNASQRNTTVNFSTPVKVFGFSWQNAFNFTERVLNYPVYVPDFYRNINDTTTKEARFFAQQFRSDFDWVTQFALRAGAYQGTWNITPTVALENVGGAPLFVRTERTQGRWVAGRKRVTAGVTAAPTFYAFFPGIFGAERFRHSISPTISYNYAPRVELSDRLLEALGNRRQGYLGGILQNRLSFGFNTNLEAKMRQHAVPARADSARTARAVPGAADSAAALAVQPLSGGSANAEGRKLKVLSLQFSSVDYNIAQSDSLTRRAFSSRGFTTENFSIAATTDLVPGLSFNTNYSLFRGNPLSDTASFKPYRLSTSISFSLDRSSALLGAVTRLFGLRLAPSTDPTLSPTNGALGARPGGDPQFAAASRASRVAGSDQVDSRYSAPTQDFQLSLSYSENRQRNDFGGTPLMLDQSVRCRGLVGVALSNCEFETIINPQANDSTYLSTTAGAQRFLIPATRTVNVNSSFHITQKWGAQFTTIYDIQRNRFSSNQVQLSRELHDWRANFNYTAVGNGNSVFSFFISLKAEPDVSFPYNRTTVGASR